ncbi:dockerin type I domain-containing protein, partial [Candidatus Bathyarchaeota archaeon]|nr:dockerin type I domain-containing protein [Candidatus Bathyarchaeota archaeon]
TVEGTLVHYVKCVTVDTTIPPENIIFPLEVRIYYTDQEVISTYVDQSTLRMYYWNETKWILEEDTGAVAPSDIPGYAGYVWAKIYHLSLFSVWGQPLLHDVAVTSLTTSKTVVGRGYLTLIDATLENHGGYDETVSVTFYTNTTAIGSIPNIVLTSGNSRNVAFPWNTTTFAKGNYTISAYAQPVSGETDTADNTFVDGLIKVSCVGDLNGDYVTDGQDYQLVKNAIPSMPELPKWNPNADLNDDGIVDGQDFQTVKNNIGQSAP